MYKMCSFQRLTRNIETVLYAFLASDRSTNPIAYMKDSSLRQYLTTSSRHRCIIAAYNHLSPEIADSCRRVHFLVQVENI